MTLNPILNIRHKKNATRLRMARESNVPYSTLVFLEGGGVNAISKHTVEKLSKYADIPATQIQQDYQAWREEARVV